MEIINISISKKYYLRAENLSQVMNKNTEKMT